MTVIQMQAQSPLAIGQWRAHLPFRFGNYVTQSNTKIYYSAGQALLALDKSDLSTEFITKVDGLSNAGIDIVKYHPGSDVLAVVYSNSVIDLVKRNEIVTLNQIRNFTNLPGQKKVNGVFTLGASQMYLAASYGVSLLNLSRNQFEFTTFTGISVNSVAVLNNIIYAATNEGIYRSPVGGLNIADFNNWTLLGPEQGFPAVYRSVALAVWNNRLYADVNNDVMRLGDQGPELFHSGQGIPLRFLSAEGTRLLVGFGNCSPSGCTNARVTYFASDGSTGQLAAGCVSVPLYALEDQQGRIWFADAFNGYRFVKNVTDPVCTILEFNTPRTPNNYQIKIRKNEVWVAAGGVDQTFTARGSRQGFYSLIDGIWNAYTPENSPALRGENAGDPNDDLTDFLAIAFHPGNGKIYAASFREGLIEFDGQQTMKLFNENNSSLGNAVGDEARTRVAGLAFDKDNNLWISNHRAARPISVLKKDGTWQNFAPSCELTEIHQVAIDPSGNKWFVSSNQATGVLVFHEGNLEVNGDERCRIISQTNSNLPSNATNCVAVDLDGDVWVGTVQGVVIFECGDPFNAGCVGTIRPVERNGFLGELLGTEDVLTITVDGADRKWVGTRNGVYLLSPDGREEIHHFTTDNSPLPDNTVGAIGIDSISGEVFFGTLGGIVSYRSDATVGSRFQTEEVTVFPNPVRPEYDGPIAIKGLTRDAVVKITNVHGQLVFETRALGGQAIWDGRDFNGRRAPTGVYLVFAVSNPRFSGFTGQPETAMAKILFVN